jgi:hypothetical protein
VLHLAIIVLGFVCPVVVCCLFHVVVRTVPVGELVTAGCVSVVYVCK